MNEESVILASGGEDVKCLDVKTGAVVETFNPHRQNISTLCWSHNNQMLVSTSSGADKISLTVFKNDTKNTVNIAEGEQPTCAALNSTSRYLVSGGKNNTVSLWDLKLKKIKKSYKDHNHNVNAVTFNWNTTYLVSGDTSGEILIFSILTNQCSGNMKAPKSQTIRQLQYSHHRKALLGSVSDDGGLYLWDTNTRVCMSTFSGSHRAPATGLCFSPFNDMLIASVGLDKRIVYYDVQGKTCVKSITAESPLTSIDFLHDGATLAVGTTRGQVLLYDLRSGEKPFKTITAHKSSVHSLRFQHPHSKLKKDPELKTTSAVNRGNPLSDNPAPPSVTPQNIDPVSTDIVVGQGSETNGNHDIITVNGDHGNGPGDSESNGHTVTEDGRATPNSAAPLSGNIEMSEQLFSPLREGENVAYSSTYPHHQSQPGHSGSMSVNSRVQPPSTGHYSPTTHQTLTHTGIFSPLSGSSSVAVGNGRPYSPVVKTPDIFGSPHVNFQPVNAVPTGSSAYPSQYRRMQYRAPVANNTAVVNGNHQSHVTTASASPRLHSNGRIQSPLLSTNTTPRDSTSVSSSVSAVSQSSDVDSNTDSSAETGTTVSTMPGRLTRSSPHPAAPHTRDQTPVPYTSDEPLKYAFQETPDTYTELLAGAAEGQYPSVGGPPVSISQPQSPGSSTDGGMMTVPQSIQLEFIKNTVREAMDEIKEQLHKDIVNVQVEMLRQSFIQEQKLKELSVKCEVNQQLMAEVKTLREENEILKNKF